MRRLASRYGWIRLAAALLALAAWQSPAVGDDKDDLVDGPARNVVNNRGPIVRNAPARIHFWVYYGNQFGARETPQAKMESLLRARIADIERAGALSEEQKQKLLLAGAGDIRGLIDRVEQLKSRYRSRTFDHDGWMQMQQQAKPLRLEFLEGPFSHDSLFAKTLVRILTPEQTARVESEERSRLSFRHRAGVRVTVLQLSTALGLSENQRQHLEQLLMAETHPAPILNDVLPSARYLVIYVQLAHIPREQLKPLFHAWQWQALQLKLAEMPKYAEMLERFESTH